MGEMKGHQSLIFFLKKGYCALYEVVNLICTPNNAFYDLLG